MSPMSPITVPAMTGPTPKISVRVVRLARTAAASFFFVSRSWGSRLRRSSRNWAASSKGAWAEAAGDGFAQHRREPAGGLVAGPGQVTVPLGPPLQHGAVVIGGYFPPC